MQPRLSFVTLGVSDLARATAFYCDVLGLPQKPTSTDISFFELGKTWLALYPRELLAQDATVSAEGTGFSNGGFRGFTLAHNVKSRDADQRQTLVAQSNRNYCSTRDLRRPPRVPIRPYLAE